MSTRRFSKMRLWEALAGYLFVAPLVIYLIVFQFIPMGMTLYLSLTKWNMRTPPTWVGLANYKNLLTNHVLYPNFWPSLLVTMKYVLYYLPLSLVVPLFLALLLNARVKGQGVFKTLYYIPCVTSSVAVIAMWKWLLDPLYGLVNRVIAALPLINRLVGQHAWLKESGTVLPSLAGIAVWAGVGGGVLIYLAALKSIPNELYEAAAIDGATWTGTLRRVTLPLLKPAFFFMIVTGFIGSFQVFDAVYLVDSTGGANGATLTYVVSLYNHAFRYFEMGTAAAMSYVLLVVLAVVTFLNFKFVPQNYE
ncbi:MAG: carbohydrate ABC transporter permease [Bacteroidota bacterium]